MNRRSIGPLIVQGVLVVGLAVAVSQAVETAPGPSTPTAVSPTRCEVRRINLADPDLKDHTIECSAADATSTAYIMVAVTVTPCERWNDQHRTPIPSPRGLPTYLSGPCAVVAHDEFWAEVSATETAGIIDGSIYGLHVSNGAPLWTPTIFAYGTVPADELASYPATLTAMPQETPIGWRLDGDRWVMDSRRQP